MGYYSDEEITYVDFDVDVIRETDRAILVNDGDEEFWIPKSVMESWPDPGKSGEARIAEWFALKNFLI